MYFLLILLFLHMPKCLNMNMLPHTVLHVDKQNPKQLHTAPTLKALHTCLAGSAEAQEALQKFTSFLEAEAEQGHISRSLEKKVLGMCL
jgi:hypothetical protein